MSRRGRRSSVASSRSGSRISVSRRSASPTTSSTSASRRSSPHASSRGSSASSASRLPLGAVFQAPTIEKLAVLVESDDSAGRWTSLVPIQPNGSEPPLFCVHGGAGTVLHLQPLAQLLGPEQPFYGLQARGLYGGAPPLRSVEEMAEHYLDELRTVQPEGPYYISGYCFGAIVAFEIAQRLLREGESSASSSMFNGPSPTWIRRYGGISRQPSKLAARTARPAAAPCPSAWSASSRIPRRCAGGLATFAGASGTGSSTPRVCASR